MSAAPSSRPIVLGAAFAAWISVLHAVPGFAADYVISLEESASPSERSAARELQSHLEACTGAELPILTAPIRDGRPMIVVGRGPTAERLGVRPSDGGLGEQGCLIRTVPPHLVIAGTAAYGTLHGVRDFLEKEIGVRWYAPDVTRTPRFESLEVAPIDRIARPAFLWRSCSYGWPGAGADFLGRRGLNSGDGGADAAQGLQYSFDGTCHTYFSYVDPAEFFDAHPEYFSEIGGQRIREETQLCLTNPRMLEIVVERMLRRMREIPHARQHNFSQMDWYHGCECAKCREINRRYGTPGATQFWFVNELAARTSTEFPRKLIGTLAYTYTEEPPQGMTMHPNVAVWVCHMFPSCDSHPIESCPRNAEYRRRAEAWSRICSHLYAWHYVVDFAHYYNPFPNFRALAADLRFYRRLGVEGVFAQATGDAGEFSLLRGYLVTELLEDPAQDADAIIADFLDGYHGAAAEPIRRYIDLLHDTVERDGIHMHLYTNPAQGYLTDEVMAESARLFDRAEAAVKDDPILLERVRVARMPLVYAGSFPRNGYAIDDGVLRFRGPFVPPAAVGDFVARMARHGFASIREIDGAPEQMALTRLFHEPMTLVVLENGSLRVEVAPLLGGRALRIIHRGTGRCVTAHDTRRNLYFPFCGGEESRVGESFAIHAGGLMSPFTEVARTARSVTLAAETANGWTMTRHLEIAEDRPALTVRVEVGNPSDRPRTAQLHAHLSLDLGRARDTRVRFVARDGTTVDRDMAEVIAGLREGERFREGSAPAEEWTFSGPDGLVVTQRFPRAQVASTWLYCYPEEDDELEVELLSPRALLRPGQSVRLEHTLEINAGERTKRAAAPPRGKAVPILSPRFFPGWQARDVSHPFVVMEAPGRYRMWYSGSGAEQHDECVWDQWVTGHVTSTDTLSWRWPESYEQVLFARKLLEGDALDPDDLASRFDSVHAVGACVLRDGPGWKAWYTGWNGRVEHAGGGLTKRVEPRIGHARSEDGLAWVKVDGAGGAGSVLGLGEPGQPDSRGAADPHVLGDGGTYRMWYAGHDGSAWRLLHAASADGVTWTRHGVVLEPGAPGSPDELGLGNPMVLRRKGRHELWYQGRSRSAPRFHVLRAVSADGREWSKVAGEVTLHPDPPISGDQEVLVDSALLLPDGAVQVFFAREVTTSRTLACGTLLERGFHIWTEVVDP